MTPVVSPTLRTSNISMDKNRTPHFSKNAKCNKASVTSGQEGVGGCKNVAALETAAWLSYADSGIANQDHVLRGGGWYRMSMQL